MIFRDRVDAGRRLAKELRFLQDKDLVVLGLPRGGVPVAYEVAKELAAPLDVIVVRKLGVPWQPELAMGAVGEGGANFINEEIVRLAKVSVADFTAIASQESAEVERRATRFRGSREAINLKGRTALIVDDGIATGATALAACKVAHLLGAEKVIVASPIGAADSIERIKNFADQVICLEIPRSLLAVGEWYEDFSPTSDQQVIDLLQESRANHGN